MALAGALLALIFFVLRMDQVIAEYREMSRAMLVAFALLGNVTLLLYDRLLGIAVLMTVAALAVFFMGRKMTGKKLERPEAGTSAGA